MIALVVIALAAGLALACGGNLGNLRNATVPAAPLVLGLFVLQGVARGRFFGLSETALSVLAWSVATLVLTVVLLLAGTGAARMMALGFGFNLLAVLTNGYMPVVARSVTAGAAASPDSFYSLAGDGTRLAVLGDVLALRLGDSYVLSVGDVLILVGVAAFVVGQSFPSGADDLNCRPEDYCPEGQESSRVDYLTELGHPSPRL